MINHREHRGTQRTTVLLDNQFITKYLCVSLCSLWLKLHGELIFSLVLNAVK